jgi:hypothetical protein
MSMPAQRNRIQAAGARSKVAAIHPESSVRRAGRGTASAPRASWARYCGPVSTSSRSKRSVGYCARAACSGRARCQHRRPGARLPAQGQRCRLEDMVLDRPGCSGCVRGPIPGARRWRTAHLHELQCLVDADRAPAGRGRRRKQRGGVAVRGADLGSHLIVTSQYSPTAKSDFLSDSVAVFLKRQSDTIPS